VELLVREKIKKHMKLAIFRNAVKVHFSDTENLI